MKIGTTYSKKKYKLYAKVYSIVGIIFIVLGGLIAIPVLPFGIIVLGIGVLMVIVSKEFKKSSIEGGHSEEVENFISTSEVKGYIKFNDNTKQVLISPEFNPRIVNYSDILDFELIQDGKSIVTKSSFEESFFGGFTSKTKSETKIRRLRIKILVKDMNNPNAYIDLIKTSVETDSFIYKVNYEVAQKILSMLKIVTSQA